jgi:hypothetical protein
MSSVKYELGFYIPEDILHSRRPENLESYIIVLCFTFLLPVEPEIQCV